METRIKHIPSGEVYANRKDAKQRMGAGNFNRALRAGELIFFSCHNLSDIIF